MAERIIGREREVASVGAALDAVAGGPIALLLEGEPGIGKTTLWREAVRLARERSFTVLLCRPSGSEARLSFAGLADLLRDVPDDLLADLPDPQRTALEIALLRREPGRRRPERRAVATAFLGVLRALAASGPVLLAVDDPDWLDAPSSSALEFAARRLGEQPVALVATVRHPLEGRPPAWLHGSLADDRLLRLEVGPLGPDDIDRLIRDRLEVGVPRPVLRRLHLATGGNPFFALEVARALAPADIAAGAALPVPGSLRESLAGRITALPARTREVLLAAALATRPTVALVQAAVGGRPVGSALTRAEDAAVVEVGEDSIHFTHPLLASVIASEAPPERTRRLHRRLAEATVDPEERARHLALAAEGPVAALASTLEAAARHADARGAPDAAAELLEMARRFTPPDRPTEAVERALEAGGAHFRAGDAVRAEALNREAADAAPPGPLRARALDYLGKVVATVEGWREAAVVFERGLTEAGDEPSLRISPELGLTYAALFTGDLPAAERHARAARSLAGRLDHPGLLAESLQALGFVRFVLGRGFPRDLMRRAVAMEKVADEDEDLEPMSGNVRPTFVLAQMLKYTDQLEAARSTFRALLEQAAANGDESGVPVRLHHLAELECRAGDWEAAARYAEESLRAALQTGMGFYEARARFAVALVEAHKGRVEAARAAAEASIALAERTGTALTVAQSLGVLGFLELSLGNPERAHGHLSSAVDRMDAMGLAEPGMVRVVPDAAECLVAMGRLDEAASLLGPFRGRARRLHRTWALAGAARGRALVAAGGGDTGAALSDLKEALSHHETLGQPFELARTLLVLGVVHRRARHKRAASDALEQALAIFEDLGAPLWSEKARAELARIGGRAPSPLALTPTEQRVARLVAEGRTNREAADALFMSVHTVEWNLSRIYRKLGIRSRSELAAAMAGKRDPRDAEPH